MPKPPPTSANYVALLKGINVGGNHKIPMEHLKKTFGAMGFSDVKTLLASGNVIFSSKAQDDAALTKTIEAGLKKTYGYPISTMVRSLDEIAVMAKADPFKGIPVTKDTRLYVSFFADKPKTSLKIPYLSPDKSFRILSLKGKEAFSVLTLDPETRSIDVMNVMVKDFGKNDVTTRNWNTVLKLVK